MTMDERMTKLLDNLTQDFSDIAQFLTDARNKRDEIFKNGTTILTDSELVALESINHIIESTEIKLDEISESIRQIRKET